MGATDAFGRTRRTGSTTRMLEEAVRLAREERRAVYVVAGSLGMVTHIERALDGLLAPEERRHRLGIKVESWASFGVPNTETGKVRGAHPNCVVLMDHHAAETRFRWVLLQWLRFAEPNGPAVIEPDHTRNRERIAALEKACEQRAAERDALQVEKLDMLEIQRAGAAEITALRARAETAEADLVTTMRVARAFFDSMSAALRRHDEPELDMRLVDELNEILARRGALAQPEQPDDSSQTSSSSGGVCLAPAPAADVHVQGEWVRDEEAEGGQRLVWVFSDGRRVDDATLRSWCANHGPGTVGRCVTARDTRAWAAAHPPEPSTAPCETCDNTRPDECGMECDACGAVRTCDECLSCAPCETCGGTGTYHAVGDPRQPCGTESHWKPCPACGGAS